MSLSQEYDRWHGERNQLASERRDVDAPWSRLVLEYLGTVENQRVLEIACGRGGLTIALATRGARMIAADFSGAALQIGRRRALENGGGARISWTQADIHNLPFPDGSFDIVVSCETIEHAVDPLRSMQELARVCRPGGWLYLTTPNYLNFMGLYRIYDVLVRGERRSEESQPHDNFWTVLRIRRMLRLSGWLVVQTDGTVHQFPFPGREPIRIHFLERSRAIRRLLGNFALHHFVMARKKAA